MRRVTIIDCKYFVGGECGFAAGMIGISLPTTQELCKHCIESDSPMSLNRATGSLIAGHLLRNRIFDERNPVHAKIRAVLTVEPSGVGTELKKLISWFPIPNKTNCRSCRNLEAKMNRWGPDTCEAKMQYIIGKLRIAAKRRGIPFVECAVRKMVYSAIKTERGKAN